ncbi:MAG: FAD-dependent oxidoreductase [Clostridiales Family XIII bacterium]|jgi:2,4-dienoyl-CoA reductase-like NADH-dependent reductase (Old Yellow Enzyme family)/thioredoxin reductase|nr:FAD-dependent oxidoreductase [Clostridiales Family XIII bacterium]
MDKLKHVLSPIKIGSLEIKNRIELAPACFMLATHDGYVTREMVAYFKNIAKGGAGIITMGETPIDRKSAPAHEYSLNVGDDKVIHGLSDVVEAVHRYGAVLSVELNHSGRIKLNGDIAIGPSPIPTELEEELAIAAGRPKRPVAEMTLDMIADIIDTFANAAVRCQKAGMEMILLHGGHGHLIGSFLSPYSNRRTDSYGGSLENRAKFAIEVIDEIRRRCGRKLAIEMRISANELVPGGLTEEETIPFVKMIEDKIDLIHVSAGLLGNNRIVPEMIQPTYWPHCYHVHRAAMFKKELKIPVTTVGSIPDMETADRIIAEGKADVVAMARAILVDPEIVNKANRGCLDDVRPCMRCFACNKRTRYFYPIRCAGNPVLGRELDYAEIRPALQKKKIAIVGGGPAGMQAAQIVAQRGHEAVLYERSSALGGNLIYAAGLAIKADLKRFLEYMVRQTLKTKGLTVKLNTEATAALIRAENPDELIVAVGADPILPSVPGVDKPHVLWVGDVDAGGAKAGQNVVVVGGGSTGAETALQLAIDGKNVTLTDMLDYEKQLAPEYPRGLSYKLEEHRVTILDRAKLEEINDDGAVVIDKDWNRRVIPADTVILSLGFKPRKGVAEQFKGIVSDVRFVGDCVRVGDVYSAIHGGFDTAVEL